MLRLRLQISHFCQVLSIGGTRERLENWRNEQNYFPACLLFPAVWHFPPTGGESRFFQHSRTGLIWTLRTTSRNQPVALYKALRLSTGEEEGLSSKRVGSNDPNHFPPFLCSSSPGVTIPLHFQCSLVLSQAL